MKLYLGIATCGRRELLARTLADIAQQSLLPDQILVAPINMEKDVGDLPLPDALVDRVKVIEGPPGLPAQRNTIINALPDDGVVLFLDDDFVMHVDYCKKLIEMYQAHTDVVGSAGLVVRDGAKSEGILFEHARSLLDEYQLPAGKTMKDNGTTYGCNMAFRLSVVKSQGIVFDENLPLYGWFEDLDFSAQVARHGRVVIVNQCVGVHLGHKLGRTSGQRLGYSQVVNPLYMFRKGTMPFLDAFINIVRRVCANGLRSLKPEPWVDRKGRFIGNMKGIADALLGKAYPDKILDM